MNENVPFFTLLENLSYGLKHQRLAEVSRIKSFAPGESFGPHSHLRIEINYVKRGRCFLLMDNERIPFREGQIMIIKPHAEHVFEAGRTGVTLLQLEFLPEVFSMYRTSGGPSVLSPDSGDGHFIKIDGDVRMMRVVQRIINELNTSRVHYRDLVILYYAELLILIDRYLKECYLPAGSNRYLADAIRYMQTNLQTEIRIDSLAAHLGISERYVRKLFSQAFHVSPVEYLNRLRINQAVELLKNTELTIKEICYRCGFNTVRHFSRMFKRYMGVIPTGYRR